MTRKHFTIVAEAIRAEYDLAPADSTARLALDRLTEALADEFRDINPHFNRAKFIFVATGRVV